MYPAVCGEKGTYGPSADLTDVEVCKKELATITAHFAQETGAHWSGLEGVDEEWRQGLYWIEEIACAGGQGGDSCNYMSGGWSSTAYPRGSSSVQYYGRGAKQLSWNYNYGPFSKVIFGDKNVLLKDP